MMQVPAQASVFVMHESVNFRKGIDGMVTCSIVDLTRLEAWGRHGRCARGGRQLDDDGR